MMLSQPDDFFRSPKPRPTHSKNCSQVEASDLIQDALLGEEQALTRLVDRLIPLIQSRVARALIRKRMLAAGREVRQELEDFTQDVFVSLLANQGKILRSWRQDGGLSFDNYIGLITDRQVATILRTGKRNPWKEDPTMDECLEKIIEKDSDGSFCAGVLRSNTATYKTEGRVASKQMLERLWERLLEELSPRGRNLFILLYLQEFSIDEVCSKLDMSHDAVYAWRSRLVRRSRSLLEEITSENQPITRRS